ncbi:MAG TPA: phosphate propanoyltransferase [Kofleriaceae bacterium]
MTKTKQILLVDIVGTRVSYDLYEIREDRHLTHGVIDGEAPATVLERLNEHFGDRAIIAQRVLPASGVRQIPVGVSVRHVHLDRAACDVLFGLGYELAKRRPVSQPGQFVTVETVDIIGPKGEVRDVAIINPLRAETQVELARSDAIHLGVDPPLRESGDLTATPGVRLRGPCGELELSHGAIIAQRHVHMNPEDARRFGVHDHDIVQVQTQGDRELLLGDVVVRVAPDFILDLHVDTDEANAAGLDRAPFVTFAGVERRIR